MKIIIISRISICISLLASVAAAPYPVDGSNLRKLNASYQGDSANQSSLSEVDIGPVVAFNDSTIFPAKEDGEWEKPNDEEHPWPVGSQEDDPQGKRVRAGQGNCGVFADGYYGYPGAGTCYNLGGLWWNDKITHIRASANTCVDVWEYENGGSYCRHCGGDWLQMQGLYGQVSHVCCTSTGNVSKSPLTNGSNGNGGACGCGQEGDGNQLTMNRFFVDEKVPTMGPSDKSELPPLDELSIRLREEALQAMKDEPELTSLLQYTILAPGVQTFEDAVASTITYRIFGRPCHLMAVGSTTTPEAPNCPNSLQGILQDGFMSSTIQEAGHTMAEAVRLDALAMYDRDPAVDSVLEVVLFLKGFAALVTHRAAYYKWHTAKNSATNQKKKSLVALWLQSQASVVFGLDIHPAATMGAGIVLDHGTGIVIGETATVGDGCTLLHGVTLGGTGKQEGDRHPKVGANVLIGANASVLGNISIGNGAKIGAGSIVLGHIPAGATAVGAPAKIIGRAKEAKPGSPMDETLQQVSLNH